MLAVERISVGVEHEFFGAVEEVGVVGGVTTWFLVTSE